MAKASELLRVWRDMAEHEPRDEFDKGAMAARRMCAFDFEQYVRTAWKPVTEPPTEADKGDTGKVVYLPKGGSPIMLYRDEVKFQEDGMWARISDVVLLPEGSGE